MEIQNNLPKLNPFELEAVLKWVDSFELTRCRRRLNRDFSDCVLLAEILKFEFPSIVDLHNYNGCFSVQSKIENWDTLNRKVLKKMQMTLKSEEIEKLAKAETNCIEEILFQVMKQIQIVKNSNINKSKSNVLEQASDVMTVKVWK
jgi:CH-like domain in sperm protein